MRHEWIANTSAEEQNYFDAVPDSSLADDAYLYSFSSKMKF